MHVTTRVFLLRMVDELVHVALEREVLGLFGRYCEESGLELKHAA
jgi:hypothetical protein